MEELGNTDCMAQLYCSLVSVAGHLLLTARAGDTVEPALLPGGCLDVTPPPPRCATSPPQSPTAGVGDG